jgi:hypothetical protein
VAVFLHTAITIAFKMNDDEISHFQVFRDCLATPIIEKSSENQKPKKQRRKAKAGRKTVIKPLAALESEEPNDAEELEEFIDVCIRLHQFQTPLIDRSILRRKYSWAFHLSSVPSLTQPGSIRPRFKLRTPIHFPSKPPIPYSLRSTHQSPSPSQHIISCLSIPL